MANSRDFTGKNRKFTGTKGIVTPKGTTGQRVGAESGEFRFNTTTELMEYYDGNQWKPIDAPPTISSISTSDAQGTNNILNADGSTLYTITITGGNFSIGVTVKFIGNTGTEYAAGNVTRVSNSSITCKTTSSMGTTDDPYDVQVTNTSGLAATLEDAFTFNAPPVFTVASGQLGTVYNGQTISGTTLNAGATDAEGNSITHTIISGALPGSGLSISSSTGAITGTLASTPSLGNYPFVVRAATTEGTVERQFSIQVVAEPNITVEYMIVAGGGGGGGRHGGGGGAGGLKIGSTSIARNSTNYPITVGNGGAGGSGPAGVGAQGNSSSAFSVSTTGGGGGMNDGDPTTSRDGGSGGGGTQPGGGIGTPAGPGSGTSGEGNNGGQGGDAPGYPGGGGGGKGAVGGNANGGASTGGSGGVGYQWLDGSYYAGGGGGANYEGGTPGSGGNGGGGAGTSGGGTGISGTANTGGGGGGSGASGTGGAGGKGVVKLRYTPVGANGTGGTITSSGGYTYHTFNDSGTFTY
jgi:hypothetical protein